MDFTGFVVESLDKHKTYVKEYKKEELLGKRTFDEFLNNNEDIRKKKGFAIYITNKNVPKRAIKNLYISENNLTQYKAKKINKELQDENSDLFVDSFEKIGFRNEDRMKRTLWFGPISETYAGAYRHRILDMC